MYDFALNAMHACVCQRNGWKFCKYMQLVGAGEICPLVGASIILL